MLSSAGHRSAGVIAQPPHTLLLHTFFFTLDDPGAAQFASPAFSPAFRPGCHFHFSVLVGAGRAIVESAAGGCRYWMAHPNRRTDCHNALAPPHRPVLFHHARPALVCLGVAVRHTARDSAPRLRTERS